MLIYSCLGSQLRLSHVLRMPFAFGCFSPHCRRLNPFEPLCFVLKYLRLSEYTIPKQLMVCHGHFPSKHISGVSPFSDTPIWLGVRKVPGAWLLVSMYPQPEMPNKRKSKLYRFDLGHIRQFEGFEPACGCSLAGENKSSRVMHPR